MKLVTLNFLCAMKKNIVQNLLAGLFCLVIGVSHAQESSNIRTYTPSSLLQKGQIEVKLFQNMYTQTSFYNSDGDNQVLSQRSTYYTSLNSIVFGVSESRRLNVGFDVNIKSVLNADPSSSALDVLKFGNNGVNSRTAVSGVGPTVKWQPIEDWKRVSIYSHFWIPTAENMDGAEGGPFLEYQQFQWWNQLFFDRTIWGGGWQVFTSIEAWWRFGNSREDLVQLPMSAFLSWFPSNNFTVYGMTQYTPTANSGGTYFIQSGLGGKWQFTPSWELELSYTNFWDGNNAGAGETFNVGFRFLR
jgi:hypothetical protein